MANRRSVRVALVAPCALAALLGSTSAASAHYVVASGDTLSGIALRHEATVPGIARANALPDPDRIAVGRQLAIPGRDPVQHVVEPGETLWSIAQLYGVSLTALQEANGISDPDRIGAGAALAVGDGAGSAGAGRGAGAEEATPAPASPAAAASDDGPIPAGGRGDPVVRARVGRLIDEIAGRYGWRPATIKALALHESGWNNAAVSSTGAIGIMQIMPATGDWLSQYLLRRPLDLRDHADNIEAGVAYLDYLYEKFDRDIERALAAYYEGFRRVQENGISEGGQQYVDSVLALRDRF